MSPRVTIPAEVKIYARLRARAGGQWRSLLRELGGDGIDVDLLEGGRFDPPHEGEEITAELEHEGYTATVRGTVARASTHSVAVRLRQAAAHDDEVDTDLLALLLMVVARRVARIERRAGGAPAAGPEHFVGGGHLDVRVQLGAAPWWQLTFLEHVVSWSEEEGLATATLSGGPTVDAEALLAEPRVLRHDRPWRSLCKLALQAAAQCAAAQPGHEDAFALIQKTARMGAS